MLFETIMRASIEYPLGQSLLLPSQLQTIERETYPDIYSKCGYNRNTARKALQGPKAMGGAGFIPLEAAAGTNQITNFLKHWRTPTQQAGKLLHITVAHIQYYAGISKPLLAHPGIALNLYSTRLHINCQRPFETGELKDLSQQPIYSITAPGERPSNHGHRTENGLHSHTIEMCKLCTNLFRGSIRQ